MARSAAVAQLKASLSAYLALAAALVWAGGRPARHGLVCLDERLREAAAREGFAILP
jgi:hypothetical protein